MPVVWGSCVYVVWWPASFAPRTLSCEEDGQGAAQHAPTPLSSQCLLWKPENDAKTARAILPGSDDARSVVEIDDTMRMPATFYLAGGAASLAALLVACGVQQQWMGREQGLYPALLLLMWLMIYMTTSHSLRFPVAAVEERYTALQFSATCHLMVACCMCAMMLHLVTMALAPRSHTLSHVGSLVASGSCLAFRLCLQGKADQQRARTLWGRLVVVLSAGERHG